MTANLIRSLVRSNLQKNVYYIRSGLAKGLKRRGGIGFIPRKLTKEESFLQGLDFNGRTVYDIGGYKGIFTLFFARAVGDQGKVVTFEPNPDSCSQILENVRLNNFGDKVIVQMIAIGASQTKDILLVSSKSSGLGSLNKDIKSRLYKEQGITAIEVEVDTLDQQIKKYSFPTPQFVKIDVEGLELDVLIGMNSTITNYHPDLFIEIHGIDEESKIENARSVIQFVSKKDYSIYHVEQETVVIPANAEIAQGGHLYCHFNVD